MGGGGGMAQNQDQIQIQKHLICHTADALSCYRSNAVDQESID